MVFGDPDPRVADESDMARLEIVEAAEIVENLSAGGVGAERVDREIAAGGVFFPVLGESHLRPPPVGRDIAPKSRHFDRPAGEDGGDGAMGDSGGNRLDPGLLEPANHLVGSETSGEVDVVDVEIEQGVADAAADEAGLALFRAERGQKAGETASPTPARLGQLHSAGSRRRLRLTIIAAVAPHIRRPCHSIS